MTTLQSCASPRSLSSGRASRGSLGHFLHDEEGATAIEYALIATGIAAAIISTVFGLGTKVSSMYESVSSALPN